MRVTAESIAEAIEEPIEELIAEITEAPAEAPIEHSAGDLIDLFDQLFAHSENTRLVRGDDEPVYIPAGHRGANFYADYHQIIFAHGYFASALHEIAHWCIAGEERRQQLDYGYWYAPDGRSLQQQQAFEQVEVKPQALEWLFSRACRKPFRVSIDNLNGDCSDPEPFKKAVLKQARAYCGNEPVPGRADMFRQALCRYYGGEQALSPDAFQPEQIGLH